MSTNIEVTIFRMKMARLMPESWRFTLNFSCKNLKNEY
jgi:hypothetical protein